MFSIDFVVFHVNDDHEYGIFFSLSALSAFIFVRRLS